MTRSPARDRLADLDPPVVKLLRRTLRYARRVVQTTQLGNGTNYSVDVQYYFSITWQSVRSHPAARSAYLGLSLSGM
jgi:hypothetical protein